MSSSVSISTRNTIALSIHMLISRFPIPTIIVLIVSGILAYMTTVSGEHLLSIRLVMTLIVVWFASIGVSLSLEATDIRVLYRRVIMLAVVVYGYWLYQSISLSIDGGVESISYTLLHLFGFVGLVFFAPYISTLATRKNIEISYTNYFARIAWVCLMSVIVGVSVLALGYIAITTVIALFDLGGSHDYDIYRYWAIISLSLLAPLYTLVSLPCISEIEDTRYESNRFFAFLIRYLAVPAAVLYFVILYAYSIRVLIDFAHWPKGMISWLVIGFSVFGYLTYIFSKSYEDEYTLVRIWRRYFPFLVIPQVGMLAYALYLRIAEYDLTMNRYLVIVGGIWLIGISLYLIVSRVRSLVYITASLSLISLIISVGPWSIYHLPLERQYARLIEHLETAGIRDSSGKIVKTKPSLDLNISNQIYSEISYVCDYDNCSRIKALFAHELIEPTRVSRASWESSQWNHGTPYTGMSKYEIVSAVTQSIGVQQYGYSETSTIEDTTPTVVQEPKYITYDINMNTGYNEVFPLEGITGYDSLVKINTTLPSSTEKLPYIGIYLQSNQLSLFTSEGSGSISLDELNTRLTGLYSNKRNANVSKSDLIYTTEINGYEIRLLLDSYGHINPLYQTNGTDNFYAVDISGYALIKNKK